MKRNHLPFSILGSLLIAASCSCNQPSASSQTALTGSASNLPASQAKAKDTVPVEKKDTVAPVAVIDTADYRLRMIALANNDPKKKWPAKIIYPLNGALLPYNRIIAYYGNLYSKRMGVLGEYPKDVMIKKLQGEVARWQAADSTVKTIPALHYIAVTAQGSPGADKKYRLRMPFKQIDTIVSWAREINAPIFLDIQVAHSSLQAEVPQLVNYLKMQDVHLGIDPEFSLKNGEVPGSRIGSFNENDINYTIDYLADLVRKNNLPPKVLIIHRFTQGMVSGYDKIKNVPEVQVVMDMDGWGSKILKKSTWLRYIYAEPVQFTGFKLFYKNDLKKNNMGLYTPGELVNFTPKPIYIQYQ